MLLTADADPTWADSSVSWLSIDNNGHVSDSDAASTNYDDLLAQMKQAAVEGNDERVKKGFPPIEFFGWAEPPHYDPNAKTLYWARRLRFGNDQSRR